MIGGIPAGYKSKYTHGDGKIMHMIGPCSKGDMGYSDDKKLCGGCEMYHGKSLVCSRCKDQVYCSKTKVKNHAIGLKLHAGSHLWNDVELREEGVVRMPAGQTGRLETSEA